MLGRGVKRKWSCLDELEAEELHSMVSLEEKRQGSDGEEELKSSMSRVQQRELVLGLCLEKLQHYQAGMELSLRRSVLLVNTLRQIQEEMRRDGTGGCGSEVHLHAIHPDSRLLRDDFREDVSVACRGCVEGEAENLPLSPPLSPEAPPSEEVSGPPGPPEQQKPLPATGCSSFSEAGSAMGYLSDLALDDIFEDIDTSMYESSDLPSSWTHTSLWPVTLSLWPDEDLKLRSPGASSPASLQSCLMDLNELDHIMEILVKS